MSDDAERVERPFLTDNATVILRYLCARKDSSVDQVQDFSRHVCEWCPGPHKRSNWIIPSILCVGGWPFRLPRGRGLERGENKIDGEKKIDVLLGSGIRTFVCLVDVTESIYKHRECGYKKFEGALYNRYSKFLKSWEHPKLDANLQTTTHSNDYRIGTLPISETSPTNSSSAPDSGSIASSPTNPSSAPDSGSIVSSSPSLSDDINNGVGFRLPSSSTSPRTSYTHDELNVKKSMTLKEARKSGLEMRLYQCPMPDGGVGEDDALLSLVKSLVNEILECPSRGIYIHCYGGHGRTGIVVCTLLCYMFLLCPGYSTLVEKSFEKRPFCVEDFVSLFNYLHSFRECELVGGNSRFPHSRSQLEQVQRMFDLFSKSQER